MELGIVYVPEERRSQGLILPFSIKDNITLSILDRISRFGFVPRSERQTAERFARELSIRGARMSDPVVRLSGGNQRKVVVAKSLAREPSVLLLDEPTRGIDVGAKLENLPVQFLERIGRRRRELRPLPGELQPRKRPALRRGGAREGYRAPAPATFRM
jgi:ABC-type sugar transport system ATPase subunit